MRLPLSVHQNVSSYKAHDHAMLHRHNRQYSLNTHIPCWYRVCLIWLRKITEHAWHEIRPKVWSYTYSYVLVHNSHRKTLLGMSSGPNMAVSMFCHHTLSLTQLPFCSYGTIRTARGRQARPSVCFRVKASHAVHTQLPFLLTSLLTSLLSLTPLAHPVPFLSPTWPTLAQCLLS